MAAIAHPLTMDVAGLHRAPTAEDLMTSSNAYNQLPDDREQPAVSKDNLDALAAIFSRHNVWNKFGLHLVHGHFKIAADKVMLGSTIGDGLGCWSKPMAPDLAYYSLDNQINAFFRTYTAVTREQCDKYAASVAGEPVTPEPIQGMWSYTVTAGPKRSIVQFRAHSSFLDMELLTLARDTHGTIVADCVYHGTIGQSMPLPVYLMEKLPGVPYIQVQPSPGPGRPMSPAAASRVINTVTGFARFFASSWLNPREMETSAIGALLTEYQQRISLLAEALPSRFAKKLSLVSVELPSLFSSPYPLVLSHGDLCEMNILVDHRTGHITGVIDWEDARVLPFGFSLWGFENVLGHMDSEGWHYYDNREPLVSLFWQVFDREIGSTSDRQAIAVARTVGIFCRYGFAWAKGPWVPVDESNYSMQYLDAFFNTSL